MPLDTSASRVSATSSPEVAAPRATRSDGTPHVSFEDRQEATELFVFGLSHHTATLEEREKVALPPARLDRAYQELPPAVGLRECLLLNTCNRMEIYGVGPAHSRMPIVRHLAEAHGADRGFLEEHSYWQTGVKAVQHAFEVASGLDSQMVGETEILGQLKSAYQDAVERKATGPALNRVFQKCFQAAKWARNNTGISRGQISIGNVAVELAERVCGPLQESTVLLMGTGEVGEKTAQALVSRGAKYLTVSGRNIDKARALAEQWMAVPTTIEQARKHLADFDVIVCSTAAPGNILHRADIEPIMKHRPARPMFLIDVAIPRDVEPTAADVTNVYLYNMDDLAAIANENLQARQAEVAVARKNLTERARHLWQRLADRLG